MRAYLRVLAVFGLAGVLLLASHIIPGFPHQDRDHQGSGPPSASDIAWTSWALVLVVVAFLAACLHCWWRSR